MNSFIGLESLDLDFEKLIDKNWIELHSKFGIRELKQLDKKIKSGKIDFSEVN